MGELFTYSFLAPVWGTVSDWVMVLVTGFTLWYLVKTFRSQQEVQRLQLKVTLIENEKYRLVNMPKFEISVTNSIGQFDDTGHFKINPKIAIKLLNSHIKEVSLSIISQNSRLIPEDGARFEAKDVEKNSFHEITYFILTPNPTFNEEGSILDIELKYTDPVNNKYIQNGSITFKVGNVHISAHETPSLLDF